MTLLLPDRVVLISGGTRGLGAQVAAAAVREGAKVVITGRRAELGTAVADRIGATYVRCDVADVAQARAAVAATAAANGRLDGLVNAAGLVGRARLLDATPEEFDALTAVTLRGPFFLMQAAVADMVRRGAPGAIVNVLTSAAPAGTPSLGPGRRSLVAGPAGAGIPSLAAGLADLTRAAADAHRADRIRINAVDVTGTATRTILQLLSDHTVLTGSVLSPDQTLPG